MTPNPNHHLVRQAETNAFGRQTLLTAEPYHVNTCRLSEQRDDVSVSVVLNWFNGEHTVQCHQRQHFYFNLIIY